MDYKSALSDFGYWEAQSTFIFDCIKGEKCYYFPMQKEMHPLFMWCFEVGSMNTQ